MRASIALVLIGFAASLTAFGQATVPSHAARNPTEVVRVLRDGDASQGPPPCPSRTCRREMGASPA